MTDPKSYLDAVERSEEAAGLYDRPVVVQGAQVARLSRRGAYVVLVCRESGQVVMLDRHAVALAAFAVGLRLRLEDLPPTELT